MKLVDIETLGLDYDDLSKIDALIRRSGLSYFEALKVQAVHLDAIVWGLNGILNIEADDAAKERYGDLINHLENALRKNNN
ncbi:MULTISPECIES: hypothetical protein [Paenibacillus]|uniref:Uncharacterized protein n=1 Tax=Paenibacillus peoriae TaxID=59893 RepID=A0A7H0YC13_9BACL|nr:MULTISPECIES: hypothetical protein [Paenibacillus]KAF6581631.1 hypothetical protein G9G54_04895 [Paenibacillus sp. EKM212P]KAF6623983.1 hypothetical protein H6F38_27830 [Paenibacillus sp. EKM208P]KOS02737.1 hypothetical protein AM598_10610 [Paenibacillus polymyxa]QNR68621.1 hypothetical protein IAQ67_06085 [Paenibacillus peoriae]